MLWQEYHRRLLELSETGEFLTTSQKEASASLLKEVGDYEHRINLWGGPGVGKTHVSHYLHHRSEALYYTSPDSWDASEISQGDTIVIDNAPQDRQSARLLFGDVLWSEASSVILITRQPIDDAIRRIELPLTHSDLEHVQRVICQHIEEFSVVDKAVWDSQRSGLWRYLRQIVDSS